MAAESTSSGDRSNGYEAQVSDENLPRPDPTRLTTQLVDRALAAFREVMEVRLSAMDTAIVLAAERISEMPSETEKARTILRAEMDREIQALREVVETRLTALDKATVLVAEKLDGQRAVLRSDIDGQIVAQREVLETRLGALDKATDLVADAVGRIPSVTATATDALRELIGERINGLDTATRLLAENVAKLPSDVDRAVSSATDLTQAQIRNVQDVAMEKFLAIDGTFASNALALTAALAAQKEAAAEQNKSNTLAITKSEQATKETISANAAQTATGISALASNVQDVKERVVRLESMGVGVREAATDSRAADVYGQTDRIAQVVQEGTRAAQARAMVSMSIAALSALIAIVAVIAVLIKK